MGQGRFFTIRPVLYVSLRLADYSSLIALWVGIKCQYYVSRSLLNYVSDTAISVGWLTNGSQMYISGH